ncbi:SH3 and PX domain-containing protein 2A isoform X3 [Hydra vulgaris]|uniref:SH3 and PX domain-containing protein 2A isoform X3 n=2 Tax=Hydra vulgaris TaxID=6087 RepID=A0ABM4BHS3_HYDVU
MITVGKSIMEKFWKLANFDIYHDANSMSEESQIYITTVSVAEVVKRKKPSKHYVYVINVLWSDGKQQVICRPYCKFFDLQACLSEAFPVESGEVHPSQRIIPLLPGKILFGRSEVKNVANKRKDLLTEYLQDLVSLPEKISRSSFVIDFFEVTADDIKSLTKKATIKKKEKTANNISDPFRLEQYIVVEAFKKSERNQIGLAIGEVVDVIEKHENGWWFVSLEDEQGWVPGSYLEPVSGSKDLMIESVYGKEEKFICTKPYKALQPDELSLALGDVVFVLGKCSDGWWNVRLKSDVEKNYDGFVPAVHLEKVPKEAENGIMRRSKTVLSRGVVAPPRRTSLKKKNPPVENDKVDGSNNKRRVSKDEGKKKARLIKFTKPVKQPRRVSDASSLAIHFATLNVLTDVVPSNAKETQMQLPLSPAAEIQIQNSLQPLTPNPQPTPNVDESMEDQKPLSFSPAEIYISVGNYNDTDEGILSLKKGQQVHVLEKDDGGWWYAKADNISGWVPSNFLKLVKSA